MADMNIGGELMYQNKSQSYLTTDGQSASVSWYQATVFGPRRNFLSPTLAVFVVWGAYPDEGTIYNLLVQVLLDLASAATLWSKSRRTRGHILLSHLRLGSHSVDCYDSQDNGGVILTRLCMDLRFDMVVRQVSEL
jgi:hypothetical protein